MSHLKGLVCPCMSLYKSHGCVLWLEMSHLFCFCSSDMLCSPQSTFIGFMPIHNLRIPLLDYQEGKNDDLHAQVHDQRSAMTEEEEGATDVWLDGKASSSQENSGLKSEARHMIQGQHQYYDEVHVIKEQVQGL